MRALPPGPLPTARWLTLETPHFELHFYPEEREFAETVGARRRARLPPGHALPQLAAERDASACCSLDHTDARERLRQLGALQLHRRVRRAARRDGRALRLRRLRQAADHARVHPRRPPGHDPELVSAPGRLAAGQDLRAQPVAADLLHRRARRADGVAPNDRGPPAQQLLRHAPARAVSRGAGARPRRRVGRVRPARLSGRQRPLPLRLQHPPLRRGSLRAREGPRDLAPLRRTSASPAGSTAIAMQAVGRPYTNAFGDGHLERLEPLGGAPLRAAEGGGGAARPDDGAAPDLRRAGAARNAGRGPCSSATGPLVYQRDNNDQRPAYVRLEPRHRSARAAGARVRRRPGVADARRARAGLPAPQLHPARLAHLGQRPHQLERPLPRRARRAARSGRSRAATARTSPTSRRTARRSRASWAARRARQLALVPIDGGTPRVLAPGGARLRLHARRFRQTGASSPTRAGSRAASATSTSTTSAPEPIAR